MTRLPSAVVVAILLTRCAGPSAYQRATALEDAPTPTVIAALSDPNWKLAATAAKVLGGRGPRSSTGALLAALATHDDWRVRAYSANALGVLSSRGAADGLINAALHDAELGVREEAITALGSMRDPNLGVILVAFTLHPDETLRQRAEAGLSAIPAGEREDPAARTAAARLATGKEGDVSTALAYWKRWKERAAVDNQAVPRVDAELARLSAIEQAARRAQADREAEAEARREAAARVAAEQAEAEAKAREEAAARWEAERPEREKKGKEILTRAFGLLKKGNLQDAVAEAEDAARLGIDTRKFRQSAAQADWSARKHILWGVALRAFISQWADASPQEADERMAREEAAQRQRLAACKQSSDSATNYSMEQGDALWLVNTSEPGDLQRSARALGLGMTIEEAVVGLATVQCTRASKAPARFTKFKLVSRLDASNFVVLSGTRRQVETLCALRPGAAFDSLVATLRPRRFYEARDLPECISLLP